MLPEARKLGHLGINAMLRRDECIFEAIYGELYATYKDVLSADSRRRGCPKWIERLQIIDSTTISLFSNLIFKGIGRHPKTGKKKGGIKVHANIHANEFVPSDIRFTSAAKGESFMLRPSNYHSGDILAFDRAYIDYAKFEEMTEAGVTYVTKMKKNLRYETLEDVMYMTSERVMEHRMRKVVFTKRGKGGEELKHRARIITYADRKKHKTKLISLLTNDMEMSIQDIIEIYRQRWEIELLFKQLKQNFPLIYFYGESANAIKIQIWLMVLQKRIKRNWNFSNLATMVRIMLMYYIDCYSFFEHHEKDWLKILDTHDNPPAEPLLFD